MIVHDIGESSTPYREFSKDLAERGYSTFAYDQRGHGRSGRILGHIDSFDELTSDLIQIASWARFKCERRKPFIITHGTSAAVALSLTKKMPSLCQGLILISPRLKINIAAGNRFLIKGLAEISPKVRLLHRMIPRSILSKNSQLNRITANFAYQIVTTLGQVPELLNQFHLPILVIFPEKTNPADLGIEAHAIFDEQPDKLVELLPLNISSKSILEGGKDAYHIIEAIVRWTKLHESAAKNASVGITHQDPHKPAVDD